VERHTDERLGIESPGLKDVRQAVIDCEDVVARQLAKFGKAQIDTISKPPLGNANRLSSPADPIEHIAIDASVQIGPLRSRADAIAALRQVSHFFRHNEPHSPVSLLAERAAKWAEMPLDRWLASVIKDDSTLSQLRELLDIPRESS